MTQTTNLDRMVDCALAAARASIANTGAKGALLTACHAVLDTVGSAPTVDQRASRMRAEAGGKAASKDVQKAYKLLKRYAAVAAWLEGEGLSFTNIGETLGGKQTFSVNMAESLSRTTSDDPATKAAALAFHNAKGMALAQRVKLAEKASEEAQKEIEAQSYQRFERELRAKIEEELKAVKALTKAKAKVA